MRYYRAFMLNNNKTIDDMRAQQNIELKRLIDYCFDNVPYYQRLFQSLKLEKKDINSIQDLEKLPILTKDKVRKEPESFLSRQSSRRVINSHTGGSTGAPLKYSMSPECYCRGIALLLRGWGYAGYRPGCRLAVIAGASLVSNEETFMRKAQDIVLNYRHYSSYGMDSNIMNKYLLHMNKWKPSYLRGYASSLFLFAKHIGDNSLDLQFHLNGIFSTAEVLTIKQRELIEKIFKTKVFNTYGLDDGGGSAFECDMHSGMHIDLERSIMQTVNESGMVIAGKVGKIIVTSLHNYAMPFIRYDTGDLGMIDDVSVCPCGNKRPLLLEVCGRTTDYLKLNNKIIGSPVLTVLMGKVDVDSYQIIQIKHNEIDIKYVKKSIIGIDDESLIKQSFYNHVGSIKINFIKIEMSDLVGENKHKFIINEVCP